MMSTRVTFIWESICPPPLRFPRTPRLWCCLKNRVAFAQSPYQVLWSVFVGLCTCQFRAFILNNIQRSTFTILLRMRSLDLMPEQEHGNFLLEISSPQVGRSVMFNKRVGGFYRGIKPRGEPDQRVCWTTSKTFLEKRVSMEVDNNDAFVNVSNVGN